MKWLFDTTLTYLSCNNWWIDNQLNELVEQLVQKPDTDIELSRSQCSHAGLELPLHVRFGNDDIL